MSRLFDKLFNYILSLAGLLARTRRWAIRDQTLEKGLGALLAAGLLGAFLGCTHHVPPPPISLTAGQNPITLGASTTLTANWPTPNAAGSINNGIGTITKGVPVTIAPTVDTTYTLTYTDDIGTLQTSLTVRVVPAPAITSLTAAATTVTAGTGTNLDPVFLDGTGTVDHGIGPVTSGVPVPTGALAADTTFTLTDTNAAGTAVTSSVTINVAAPAGTPVISAPAIVTAGTAGLTASVAVQAGDSYAWTITGGSITAGAATNQITFTAGLSGAVNLGCVVTNAAGTPSPEASATCAIVAPPATPVITAPADVTAGATGLTASVPAQAGASYAWTLTGGTITAGATTNQITFSAGTSGTVQLACTVTNAAGTASVPGTSSSTIVAAPGTPVLTAPAFVTAGATGLIASVPPQAGDTYTWTITGGTVTAGGTTNQVTFTAGASGSVQLGCVVTNAAGTASPQAIAFSTIVAAPVLPVISAPAFVTTGTTGLAATITNTAAEPTGSTYAWTIASGGTITAGAATASITFTAGASGTVALSCTVTTTAGATSTGTFSSTIVANPVAPVISAPASVTANATGLAATITNTAAEPTGSTYAWTLTGGTITAGAATASITFTAGASGTVAFSCKVTTTAGATSTGTFTSTIVAAPVLPVISAPALVTANAAGLAATITNTAAEPTGSTYAWTLTGGTVTAGAATASITFTAGASGTVAFSCKVTTTAGATSTGTFTSTIVASPVAPAISAPAFVTASATGLTATITNTAAEPAGSTYAWSIPTGGTITSAATGTSITFTAGASGTVSFSCTVTTTASATSTGTGSSTIVAAPTQPAVTGVPTYLSAGVTSFIPTRGTYGVPNLRYGPKFGLVLKDLQNPRFRKIVERKFGVDLQQGRPHHGDDGQHDGTLQRGLRPPQFQAQAVHRPGRFHARVPLRARGCAHHHRFPRWPPLALWRAERMLLKPLRQSKGLPRRFYDRRRSWQNA